MIGQSGLPLMTNLTTSQEHASEVVRVMADATGGEAPSREGMFATALLVSETLEAAGEPQSLEVIAQSPKRQGRPAPTETQENAIWRKLPDSFQFLEASVEIAPEKTAPSPVLRSPEESALIEPIPLRTVVSDQENTPEEEKDRATGPETGVAVRVEGKSGPAPAGDPSSEGSRFYFVRAAEVAPDTRQIGEAQQENQIELSLDALAQDSDRPIEADLVSNTADIKRPLNELAPASTDASAIPDAVGNSKPVSLAEDTYLQAPHDREADLSTDADIDPFGKKRSPNAVEQQSRQTETQAEPGPTAPATGQTEPARADVKTEDVGFHSIPAPQPAHHSLDNTINPVEPAADRIVSQPVLREKQQYSPATDHSEKVKPIQAPRQEPAPAVDAVHTVAPAQQVIASSTDRSPDGLGQVDGSETIDERSIVTAGSSSDPFRKLSPAPAAAQVLAGGLQAALASTTAAPLPESPPTGTFNTQQSVISIEGRQPPQPIKSAAAVALIGAAGFAEGLSLENQTDTRIGAPSSAPTVGRSDAPLALTPAASPDPKAVAHQITQALIRMDGARTEVILDPIELGRISLTFVTKDDGVSVLVTADRPETADLMRRNSDQLQRDLSNAGYYGVEFEFDQRTGGRREHQKADTGAELSGEQSQSISIRVNHLGSGLDIRI